MNPITRKEMFLAAAGGQNVETPTPITREEVFLDAIAKGGGGGGSSGGGVLVVHETVSGTTHTLDKTWQEIHDADFVVLKIDGHIYYASEITDVYDVFYVGFMFGHPAEDGYSCDSASGYPAYDGNGGDV